MTELAMLSTRAARGDGSDLLALGFGTSIAMWAVGYIARFPSVTAPSWLLLALLLGCLVAGGYVTGRYTTRGLRGGLSTGLVAGLLNMLVLGSLLGGPRPNHLVPAAIWWIPGSLLASALLGGGGALLGSWAAARDQARISREHQGAGAFALVAAAATFLLLVAGGIVTSQQAGLAVVDWPNSYGYNMFLYPLSRMTGGIYYEHVHRLLGSLVGLTTLVLAIHLQRIESRPWVQRLALVALLAVVVQGLLGGLRVTGHFTMSASASETAPNLTLAVVHGIWGQLFFGLMVGLAVVTSAGWRDAGPMEIRPSAALDRALSRLLVGLLMIQLMLGAILRHESSGLMIHVSMAVIVILLTITVAVRTWGLHQRSIQLRRLGPGLIALVVLQLILGVAALIARGPGLAAEASSPADVFVRTAHQGTGALLLACSVALMLWIHRLARPR